MQSTTLADGTAALAGRRIALWGLVAAKVLAGWGARIGFAVLQPVSVIEEEIAKDPTSPIAVANAIARKNGEAPGARSGLFRGLSLIPVARMVVVDPRRRPVVATLVYGITLLAAAGWSLARSPAFAPMAPDAGATLIALILTALAAVTAAVAARRLSEALGADR
jgi:hypothetical protein